MSTTTTQDQLYQGITHHLRDYEIHHSGTEEQHDDGGKSPHPSDPSSTQVSNPIDWPTEHRRVPPYRPINTNLDFHERRARDTPEAIFVFIMLSGCATIGATAKIWRATGGKFFKTLFQYRIGGEY